MVTDLKEWRIYRVYKEIIVSKAERKLSSRYRIVWDSVNSH